LTIKEATVDGHGAPDDEEGRHVKKARARLVSEQLLGRSRPKPIHEDEDGKSSPSSDLTLNNLEFYQVFCLSELMPLWAYQVVELLKRDAEAHWRDSTYLMAKLILNIVGGLFIGFTFFKAQHSIQGTQNKLFAIFMAMILR
jgi:hypothetical protein